MLLGTSFGEPSQIAVDATIKLASHAAWRGPPSRRCRARLRREQHQTYPELARARRCRLVVVGIEVGGRFGTEAAPSLLHALVWPVWRIAAADVLSLYQVLDMCVLCTLRLKFYRRLFSWQPRSYASARKPKNAIRCGIVPSWSIFGTKFFLAKWCSMMKNQKCIPNLAWVELVA